MRTCKTCWAYAKEHENPNFVGMVYREECESHTKICDSYQYRNHLTCHIFRSIRYWLALQLRRLAQWIE